MLCERHTNSLSRELKARSRAFRSGHVSNSVHPSIRADPDGSCIINWDFSLLVGIADAADWINFNGEGASIKGKHKSKVDTYHGLQEVVSPPGEQYKVGQGAGGATGGGQFAR